MKVSSYINSPNFGTKLNRNLINAFDTMAQKGYPSLEQGHLDVLKAIREDRCDLALNLNYGLFGISRLQLEGGLIARAMELIETTTATVREKGHSKDARIRSAAINAAASTLKLLDALRGMFSDEKDVALAGIEIEREQGYIPRIDKMLGLDKYPYSFDKLLRCFEPGEDNLSIQIISYYKKLQRAYKKALNDSTTLQEILKAN